MVVTGLSIDTGLMKAFTKNFRRLQLEDFMFQFQENEMSSSLPEALCAHFPIFLFVSFPLFYSSLELEDEAERNLRSLHP